MRWPKFFLLLALLSAAGWITLKIQRERIVRLRQRSLPPSLEAVTGQTNRPSKLPAPSPELLKLRAQVTELRRELLAPVATLRSMDTNRSAEEWAFAHSGPKLAEQAGFRSFDLLTHAGFATPEAAFESFMHAMLNQQKAPLTDTAMKKIWDLPEDYDDPRAKYSIDIGEGIGKENGYLIRDQQYISTNELKLTIDFEAPDRTLYRRERILVLRNGHWRVKPAAVRRMN